MPIGEIAGEALSGALRVIGRLLFELVFEILIRGTGNVLLRHIRPRADPGDVTSAVAGLLFWGLIVVGGFWLHSSWLAG